MSEHTPGPWKWMGGPHGLYLATTHSGRRYVMGFRRMGMQAAQPVFRSGERMVPAADLVTFEVGDRGVVGFRAAEQNDTVYRFDVEGIDNPDAHLIAAAPDLLEALKLADAVLTNAGFSPTDPDLIAIRAAISKAEGKSRPRNTPRHGADGAQAIW